MFETGDLSNTQKESDYSYQHFLQENLNCFCLYKRKRFVLEISFESQHRVIVTSKQTLQRIFKIAFRLWNLHVFMQKSQPIFNALNTLTLAKIFYKTKIFSKNRSTAF